MYLVHNQLHGYWFSISFDLIPYSGRENFGKSGKLNAICQYFTQPNLSPLFVKLFDFWLKILHVHE